MKKLLLFLLFPIGLLAQSPVSDATITTNITNLSNLSSTYTNEKPKIISILNQLTLSKPNILINPGYLFVGNVSGVGTGVPLSGVVSMSSSGVTTFVPTTINGFGITDAQPLNSNLTTIAGLAATTNNLIVSVGSAWASRTPAQVKATLAIANTDVSGLGTLSTLNSINNSNWSGTALADGNIASASTWNAKQNAITFGTNVLTALGVNIGSAGAPVLFNGAGGTPSLMTGTNITGIPESGVTNLTTDLAGKQATLVSGTNIKTINSTSLLGSGDIVISTAIPSWNTQTANYTLVIGDASNIVEINVAGANTLTVPPNSSVAFAQKTTITIFNKGAGVCTVTAGAGVTLRSAGSLIAIPQYGAATITQTTTTDTWYLVGTLQ